jgi:hypothetical protein
MIAGEEDDRGMGVDAHRRLGNAVGLRPRQEIDDLRLVGDDVGLGGGVGGFMALPVGAATGSAERHAEDHHQRQPQRQPGGGLSLVGAGVGLGDDLKADDALPSRPSS